jgi:Fic family protein
MDWLWNHMPRLRKMLRKRGRSPEDTEDVIQELFLREHAIIESAVSSNRIEGVSVDPSRVKAVLVSPKPLFRDRNEEEVRGYRDALAWIHENAGDIPVDENTIKRLHAMAHGQIWDAGQYKEKDGDIIERYADGNGPGGRWRKRGVITPLRG